MRTTTSSATIHGRWTAGLFGVALIAAGGCGKAPNEDPGQLFDYPNVNPVAPAKLTQPGTRQGSSGRSLDVAGDEIWVADADNGAVVVLDRESLTVLETITVGPRPEQVVVSPAGPAYVSLRGTGEVVEIDAGAVVARATIGKEAWGLAVSNGRVYATSHTSGELVVLAADGLAELARTAVGPWPTSVALMPGVATVVRLYDDPVRVTLDGQGLPAGTPFEQRLRRGSPTDRAIFSQRIELLVTGRGLGATVHPDGRTTYVSHVQLTPGREEDLTAMLSGLDPSAPPPIQQYYGPDLLAGDITQGIPTRPVEAAVTAYPANGAPTEQTRPPVMDPRTSEPMTHLLSDPSDINHHPTWSLLFQTGFGSDNVLVYNSAVDDPMASPVAEIRVGQAPKAIDFSDDGMRAYVLNAYDYTVGEIDLSRLFELEPAKARKAVGIDVFTGGEAMFEDPLQALPQVRAVTMKQSRAAKFGTDPLPADVRRGRRAFTFARNERLSRMGHFSCNTCHFEGREDKLVWVVTQGPRQTPALAGRLADTAPFNWNGTKDHLQSNMERTVGRMGGKGLTGQEKADLERFIVEGFAVPDNPNLAAGGLTPDQQRGKEIFEDPEVGCAGCHAGQATQDGANHDVGTITTAELAAFEVLQDRGETEQDNPRLFNTPTLRGLWYTAPYLHDGSAATLEDVLEQTDGWMGHTGHLTGEDKAALVAYLKTL